MGNRFRFGLIVLWLASVGTVTAKQFYFRVQVKSPQIQHIEWREHGQQSETDWRPAGLAVPFTDWTIDSAPNQVDIRGSTWKVFPITQLVIQKTTLTLSNVTSTTALPIEVNEVWNPWGIVVLAVLPLLGVGIGFRIHQKRKHRRELEENAIVQEHIDGANLFPTTGESSARIGRYKVLSRLGEGGMAYVYRVESPDKKIQALKLPMPQLGNDDEFRKRFFREMEIGAKLLHPGVVRIEHVNYAGPGDHDQYPWIVMELVEGKPWDELPRPIETAIALGYARGTLEALQYIHEAGIVHRDIKPGNVMVLPNGRIKLMDFGLALLTETDRSRLTASGQVLGTPAFMAPEQFLGSDVDARADLYALGIMVWESLAGHLPFPTGDLMVLVSHKMSKSVEPLCKHCPNLPAEVCLWVDKMVSRAPEARFSSAHEALLALPARQG